MRQSSTAGVPHGSPIGARGWMELWWCGVSVHVHLHLLPSDTIGIALKRGEVGARTIGIALKRGEVGARPVRQKQLVSSAVAPRPA